MTKNKTMHVQEMLGVAPIVGLSPDEIWDELVTPQVKAMLGPIESVKISVRDTIAGDFPGDEVTNLNQHKIHGGSDKVRFPYVNCFYKTQYGALTIKYDPLKVKVSGWFGDLRAPQLIFKVALRDRRFDGTRRANDCSLIDFMGYEEEINAPLALPNMPENSRSVELSVYSFLPGSRIVEACGDSELDHFVENPFRYVSAPKKFLELFQRAWKSSRSPGQWGNPVPDVAKSLLPVFDDMARRTGYDYIENCSSHYHVYKITEWWGYRVSDPELAALMEEFNKGIKKLKEKGMKLTRQQESWVCVIQSLPEEFIPAELNLHGPKWPQDNISSTLLWMHKPLSERARAAIVASHQVGAAADGNVSKGDGTASKGDGNAPKGDGTASKGEGTASKGDGTASKGDRNVSKGDGTASKGDGNAPKDGGTVPGEGKK